MKIGIDARMINSSGIGTVIKNIISRLPKTDKNDFLILGDKNSIKKISDFPIYETNLPIYSIQEQIFLPAIINKSKIDIFHSFHYIIPLLTKKKLIVNVHDLIQILFPEIFSFASSSYARFMIKNACNKASNIITGSQHTKNDIIEHFKISPEKIRVIYNGVSSFFKPSNKKSEIIAKHGNYILYVGNLRPHKNILRLIESFSIFLKDSKLPYKLILIGKIKPSYIKDLQCSVNDNNIENKIIFLEDVDDSKLLDYLNAASLFVMPSLYEGFGLTPLEAMACGCPVISSNTSSLPEVLGDAAIMFNPYDVNEMSEKMYEVLTNEGLKQGLITKGFERVKIFSWDKTAKETFEVYEE